MPRRAAFAKLRTPMYAYKQHSRRLPGHDDSLVQEIAIAPALRYGTGLERLGR